MLTGDRPIVEVVEMTKGKSDIVPGEYTNEVQTVTMTSLAPVVTGTFVLNILGGFMGLVYNLI